MLHIYKDTGKKEGKGIILCKGKKGYNSQGYLVSHNILFVDFSSPPGDIGRAQRRTAQVFFKGEAPTQQNSERSLNSSIAYLFSPSFPKEDKKFEIPVLLR